MILEFIGLPGAGKTTCEEQACDTLRGQGTEVLSSCDLRKSFLLDGVYRKCGLKRAPKWRTVRGGVVVGYKAYLSLLHARSRVRNLGPLGALAIPKGRICSRLTEDMVLCNHYRKTYAQQASPPVYLTSEGLAHHAASVRVFAGARFSSMSGAWVSRNSCEGMAIVHVEAPMKTAFDRLWQRGLPRSWPNELRGDRAKVMDVLLRFEESINLSLEEHRQAGARIYEIDNSGSAASLAELTNRTLATCMNQKASPEHCRLASD